MRNVFGSTRHVQHANFTKISKMHNDGRYLGFIQPSECRMGGELMQLIRIVHLKGPLGEAVNSKVFLEDKKFSFLAKLVNNENFWFILITVVRAFYILIRLLRVCDTRCGYIDRVKILAIEYDENMETGIDNVQYCWEEHDDVFLQMTTASNKVIDAQDEIGDVKKKEECRGFCRRRRFANSRDER